MGGLGSPRETCAVAIAGGCDFDRGTSCLEHVGEAVGSGTVTAEQLRAAAARLWQQMFLQGEMDDPSTVPGKAAPPEVHSPAHVALAQEAAEQAITLLQNRPQGKVGPLLPLQEASTVAFIGPMANATSSTSTAMRRTWLAEFLESPTNR